MPSALSGARSRNSGRKLHRRPAGGCRGRAGVAALALAVALAVAVPAGAGDGDPKRGVDQFRSCAACHTLVPGLHTTGPSLAGFLTRGAGTAEGFQRYSPNLKGAGFEWTAETLDAWLAEPTAMIAGTYMDIPGVWNPEGRADLIAFLEIAGGADGPERAVEMGLIEQSWLRGVAPEPIGEATPAKRVASIRHCGDSYFIATEDGAVRPYWEKNVRLKIDSDVTGPPAGVPVVLGTGQMGDRVYVIFRSVDDLRALVGEGC